MTLENPPPRPLLLILDDEPEVLTALARLFRRDYEVLTTPDPAEASRILETRAVHVLMSDQRMPGTLGVDFLRRVREAHPQVVRMLITGYSNLESVIAAINEGHVYGYISKPWDVRDIQLQVRRAAEHYALQDERRRLLEDLQRTNVALEERNTQLAAAYNDLHQLDRMKTVFMELVSHELNTPISIILGYTFLLEKETDFSPRSTAARAIRGINTSAQRLRNITNKIFHVLSTTHPEITLRRQRVEVAQLLAEVRAIVAPFVEKRQQRLVIECDEDLALHVDAQQITDALVNLVMNAIKFSPDDRAILVSAAADPDDPARWVLIRVSDQGIGINPEDQPHIFETFFGTFNSRHHSSGEYEFKKRGIGLGLSVVRRYAELHGGSVTVDSEPDVGTTFTVRLPAS